MSKVIPSVVYNYRAMYKEKFGRESFLSDQEIWDIFNSVFDDSDNKRQDEERVQVMREMEEEQEK